MKIARFACLSALVLLAGCTGYRPSSGVTDSKAEPMPMQVKFLHRKQLIADYKYQDFFLQLKITNHYSSPMWFVVPYIGNEPLRDDGMFHGKQLGRQPFTGWEFDGSRTGGKGKAIKIEYLGRHKFSAFRLPPKGTVSFAAYHVISPLNFHKFQVWVAPNILINGRTPVEEWLPYPTLSAAEVVLSKDAEGKNLDWNAERLGSRQDYPKEKVDLVWVEVKRKYTVDLEY